MIVTCNPIFNLTWKIDNYRKPKFLAFTPERSGVLAITTRKLLDLPKCARQFKNRNIDLLERMFINNNICLACKTSTEHETKKALVMDIFSFGTRKKSGDAIRRALVCGAWIYRYCYQVRYRAFHRTVKVLRTVQARRILKGRLRL